MPFGYSIRMSGSSEARIRCTGTSCPARHRTARMNEPYIDGTMVDRNLFDSQDSGILEHAATLGWDKNSVMGDPMYVDPTNGDFRSKRDRPR